MQWIHAYVDSKAKRWKYELGTYLRKFIHASVSNKTWSVQVSHTQKTWDGDIDEQPPFYTRLQYIKTSVMNGIFSAELLSVEILQFCNF